MPGRRTLALLLALLVITAGLIAALASSSWVGSWSSAAVRTGAETATAHPAPVARSMLPGLPRAVILPPRIEERPWHAIYLGLITWAYVFWNTVRILTYVPTLRMLLRPDASARHYSLATWGSWVLSNGTLALYLFEGNGHRLTALVLLNAGNTLMCLLTSVLILRLRRHERRGEDVNSLIPRREPAPAHRHR